MSKVTTQRTNVWAEDVNETNGGEEGQGKDDDHGKDRG
jgi:hypothetical protein